MRSKALLDDGRACVAWIWRTIACTYPRASGLDLDLSRHETHRLKSAQRFCSARLHEVTPLRCVDEECRYEGHESVHSYEFDLVSAQRGYASLLDSP